MKSKETKPLKVKADQKQTSYSDLLDALRLALKGYDIESCMNSPS